MADHCEFELALAFVLLADVCGILIDVRDLLKSTSNFRQRTDVVATAYSNGAVESWLLAQDRAAPKKLRPSNAVHIFTLPTVSQKEDAWPLEIELPTPVKV